ncbi:trans-1,2-dihydrobenzene-1,2-diol dehydrogenase [Lingula anatina]|uniref:Trans-1,2-dihydrobenzene-1,2-diol dehydrogenase n=1 Tax=Lingula anatina TaxID=7574 RepID=A0A1S3I656_LINAN|nr:trans-1,2-dihydrobenzene-1,2-diol dehydrogenase [Lingula anatina]|eukprot:XP_013392854.1 trans-1,2-dihydrobenzene-1,2-diol dehydrogenase [Lingula anatina]
MATRWGICSCGSISHEFASSLTILSSQEHKITAVAARDVGRAKKFAESYSIPKAYGSYEELAKDPNVDIIYVGAIHKEHHSLCKLFLHHNKPVLCEKPLTMNLKQAQEIIAVASEKKLFFMEALWSRFFPTYEQIRKELRNGSIGEVHLVEASFGMDLSELDRITQKSQGGSTLLDIGIYPIQLACMVLGGKPSKIVASGHLYPNGVDKTMSIALLYSSGAMAHLVVSSNVNLPNKAAIYGKKGRLELPETFWCPTRLITPDKSYDFPLPKCHYPIKLTHSEGLCYQAQAVRECLISGKLESSLMSHQDSLDILAITDECLRQLSVVFDVEQ